MSKKATQKKPRKPGSGGKRTGAGQKLKDEDKKAKSYPVSLYPDEHSQLINKYSSLTKAIRTLIKKK